MQNSVTREKQLACMADSIESKQDGFLEEGASGLGFEKWGGLWQMEMKMGVA